MAEDYKKVPKAQVGEMVIVAFAEDMEQAKEYEALLKNNDIPVMIKEHKGAKESNEITVMVPEDYLDEAHVVIEESQDAYEDYYDSGLDDDDDEFDSDSFEDEF